MRLRVARRLKICSWVAISNFNYEVTADSANEYSIENQDCGLFSSSVSNLALQAISEFVIWSKLRNVHPSPPNR